MPYSCWIETTDALWLSVRAACRYAARSAAGRTRRASGGRAAPRGAGVRRGPGGDEPLAAVAVERGPDARDKVPGERGDAAPPRHVGRQERRLQEAALDGARTSSRDRVEVRQHGLLHHIIPRSTGSPVLGHWPGIGRLGGGCTSRGGGHRPLGRP